MKLIEKMKYEISELKKDIRFYLDLDKPDLDDIPAMRAEGGTKYIPPLVQLSGKGEGGRIRMKR